MRGAVLWLQEVWNCHLPSRTVCDYDTSPGIHYSGEGEREEGGQEERERGIN